MFPPLLFVKGSFKVLKKTGKCVSFLERFVNKSARGEMDITLGFGPSILGSNPDGRAECAWLPCLPAGRGPEG